jgi:hypothetical protein
MNSGEDGQRTCAHTLLRASQVKMTQLQTSPKPSCHRHKDQEFRSRERDLQRGAVRLIVHQLTARSFSGSCPSPTSSWLFAPSILASSYSSSCESTGWYCARRPPSLPNNLPSQPFDSLGGSLGAGGEMLWWFAEDRRLRTNDAVSDSSSLGGSVPKSASPVIVATRFRKIEYLHQIQHPFLPAVLP